MKTDETVTMTVQNYDREAREILDGYTNLKYTRLETGALVYYNIYWNDAEIGQWIIDASRGGPSNKTQLRTVTVARARGADISYRQHADLDHIPDDEWEQHAIFTDLTRLLENKVAPMYDVHTGS